MQTVKKFVLGRDYTGNYNGNPIEDQINEYLEYHPGYSIATMSISNSAACKEAFVVFNIREERKPFAKDSGDKKVKNHD